MRCACLQLGSALQLSTFTRIKEHVRRWAWVSPAMLPVVASMASSVNIVSVCVCVWVAHQCVRWRVRLRACVGLPQVIFMEPFDVVRTRLYNQPVDAQGRGEFPYSTASHRAVG